MKSFIETVQNVHLLVRGEKKAEELAEFFNANVKRLSIYPAFVNGHVTKFLTQNFISLKSLFDQGVWSTLCEDYFKQHPTSDWRLYRCAEKFPEFIEGLKVDPRYSILDFHVELAVFEWTETSVYNSELVLPKSKDVKSPMINPTLSVLNFDYPIAKFAKISRLKELTGNEKNWLKQKDYLIPEKNQSMVFIFRNPQTELSNFCAVNDRMLFAFKVAHDQINVRDAAKMSGQSIASVKAVLKESAEIGFILLPKPL